jgi:deazaflavin-dependent oxidoreductase (nitroreductase family)
MQRIASSQAGAWLFSRILHHFDHAFLTVTRGRTTLAGLLTGLPVVVVVTTGAKTGLPRSIPLLCIFDDDHTNAFAIVASNWGQRHLPAWYFNLKKNPRAACSINGKSSEHIAHEAFGDEYDIFWQRATSTYLGFTVYKQRAGARRIPIMVMTRGGKIEMSESPSSPDK